MVILLLKSFASGRIGEHVVSFLENTFYLSYEAAFTIYQYTVRNNMAIIISLLVIILLWIFLRVIISQMTKYFNEISKGLDTLIEQSDKDITLSTEMFSLESKLNQCKHILQKREQDVRQAEQRKNELVMYLAHDIKTPLASVIGYLSLLDEAKEMPTEQRVKYIGIVLDKSYRLEELISEFFEITRYNLQSIILNKEKINLTYMLQQLTDEFYPLLTPQGKKAKVIVADDYSFYGDADKLARVFNNILKNAVAYSDENSEIIVNVRRVDNMIKVSIINHGSQIPKHQLESIFEKFYRLDVSRSSSTGGAGLGLAIAKEIVKAHQGEIYVKSDETDTVFTVELPIES